MGQQTVFILLQACNALTMVGLSLITPFFPPFVLEKGINQGILGFIISANPIGSFFAALFIAKMITNSNRYYFITMGMFLQGIGLYSYVAINYIDDKHFIIIIAVSGRLVSGIGSAFFLTPFFAFIPILYPLEIEKKISISEFISGAAQLLGPVFGSLLFSQGGFILPFIVFGLLNFIMIPILIFKLPKIKVEDPLTKRLNEYSDQGKNYLGFDRDLSAPEQLQSQSPAFLQNASTKQSEVAIQKKIPYLRAFLIYPIFMQFLMVFLSNICFTYFQPIIAIFYLDQYGIQESTVGYLMSLVTIGYLGGSVIVSQIKRGKRKIVLLGCVLNGLTYFFIGPSKTYTGVDHYLLVTLGSQLIMGFSGALIYIPAVPLLNEILNDYYPGQPLETANLASALFTSGMSVGQLTGPIVSGFITQQVGFDLSCAYLGMFNFFLGLLYVPMLIMKFPTVNQGPVIQENSMVRTSIFQKKLGFTKTEHSYVDFVKNSTTQ